MTANNNEEYAPSDYPVSTMDAAKGKHVGVVVNAISKSVLHGCRHKHDSKQDARNCIRNMMRMNNWRVNIVN